MDFSEQDGVQDSGVGESCLKNETVSDEKKKSLFEWLSLFSTDKGQEVEGVKRCDRYRTSCMEDREHG